eukprot:TRINITY_DN5820_c0_g1_i2.p1 TRINITY_DN5820_c0_g1~~TRINITY_DN5820_c0_g1_i2.p1  ORF type:complete len:688 (+),score=139.55 TRINITY_DN5820_c0_g1_i2:91-2154(+)
MIVWTRNFLISRVVPAKFPTFHDGTSLLQCPLFGAQFVNRDTEHPTFQLGEVVSFTSTSETDKRIEAVSVCKQREKQGPRHRRSAQLFQYKPYIRQATLQLEQGEIATIGSCMRNMSPNMTEARSLACGIFMKLAMDALVAGDAGICACTDLLIDMLRDEAYQTRVQAFTILLNLLVHSCVIDDVTTPEGAQNVRVATDELCRQLREMLVYLVDAHEPDERVWSSALTVVLFVSGENCIRARPVDCRVYVSFLDHVSTIGDDVREQIVQMLLTSLYDGGKLDRHKLELMGGVNELMRMYASARSLQAMQNLFVAVFDAVIDELLLQHPTTDPDMIADVFEIFRRFRAAEAIHQMLRLPLDGFVENVVRFVFFEEMSRDAALAQIAHTLDKSFIVALLYAIEAHVLQYRQLPSKVQSHVDNIMNTGDPSGESLSCLRELLYSETRSDRLQGVLAVSSLLHNQNRAANNLYSGLVLSPSPITRRCFIDITEGLVLYYRSQDEIQRALKVLNEKFARVAAVREQSEGNLLAVLDVILRLIAVKPQGELPEDSVCTLSELFLRGLVVVPCALLKEINIGVLLHVFQNLPAHGFGSERLTLLLLMLDKCKNKLVLETIGGSAMFQTLLEDGDPAIAYHASSFLLSCMKVEQPELFRAAMSRLITKAQHSNSQMLLDNSFFQMRELVHKLPQS